MTRLTARDEQGFAHYPYCFEKCNGDAVGIQCQTCDFEEKICNKLAEYEDLEEQGLLLKLPCNVGDTVYTNFSMQGWYMRKKDRPYKAKIVFVGINGEDNFMNVDLGKGAMLSFKFSEIGKTVFLTEQEAQSALEKMKAGGVNG